jgi:hypothetical protein
VDDVLWTTKTRSKPPPPLLLEIMEAPTWCRLQEHGSQRWSPDCSLQSFSAALPVPNT